MKTPHTQLGRASTKLDRAIKRANRDDYRQAAHEVETLITRRDEKKLSS